MIGRPSSSEFRLDQQRAPPADSVGVGGVRCGYRACKAKQKIIRTR